LPAIDKGLQDVLLHLQITVDEGMEFLSEQREVLDRLANAVIGDVVGGRFGTEEAVVTDVLFEEPMLVMAADHGIGEREILDDGLQFSVMMTGDPAAEDEGQFVGLTNGAIGIEEALFEGIDGSATTLMQRQKESLLEVFRICLPLEKLQARALACSAINSFRTPWNRTRLEFPS
jgi:hypothetical protein